MLNRREVVGPFRLIEKLRPSCVLARENTLDIVLTTKVGLLGREEIFFSRKIVNAYSLQGNYDTWIWLKRSESLKTGSIRKHMLYLTDAGSIPKE